MASKKTTVLLKPVDRRRLAVVIRGITPLIQHCWTEKAKRQMREKKAGRKTKNREACDPAAEFQAAAYRTADGDYGVPVGALAKAIVTAAHKDIGIEKTLVRKSMFIICDDPNRVLKMECTEPEMREDPVRVGGRSSDLRYRPEFKKWAVPLEIEYNAEMLRPEDIITLINLAGFGVGIGEWRPEKDGEYGRFEVEGG